MSVPRDDVLIVGGGPAGAFTAWALATAGLTVRVLDRARFPRDKPCSEYLSPEASRLLDAMGVLRAVEDSGAARLAGMRVRAPDGAMMQGDFIAEHGFRAYRQYGLALRRTILDALLLDRARAAGASVEEGARVVDLRRARDGAVSGVIVRGDDGVRYGRDARMVIGADGLRSVVASRLGLARRAAFPRRIAIVTHYAGVRDIVPYGEMHVSSDGYLGLAPVDGGLTNVAVVVPAAVMRRWPGTPGSLLEHRIARDPRLRHQFAGAERRTPIRVTGPFASHARRAWTDGAALVGDAADFFDPFTGEGIFAALRGAEMLAPAVVTALDAPGTSAARDALHHYERERRRAFAGKWRVERLIAIGVACPPLMNGAVRAMARRKRLADALVGVAGDFVPASTVLSTTFVLSLLAFALAPGQLSGAGAPAEFPASSSGA